MTSIKEQYEDWRDGTDSQIEASRQGELVRWTGGSLTCWLNAICGGEGLLNGEERDFSVQCWQRIADGDFDALMLEFVRRLAVRVLDVERKASDPNTSGIRPQERMKALGECLGLCGKPEGPYSELKWIWAVNGEGEPTNPKLESHINRYLDALPEPQRSRFLSGEADERTAVLNGLRAAIRRQ